MKSSNMLQDELIVFGLVFLHPEDAFAISIIMMKSYERSCIIQISQ